MYTKMTIRSEKIDQAQLYPDRVRNLVAQALRANNTAIDPIFFNRTRDGSHIDEKITDKHSPGISPAIAYSSSRGSIEIIGLGERGIKAIRDNSLALMAALSSHYGASFLKTTDGKCSARTADDPKLYRIKNLLVDKRPDSKKHGECLKFDLPSNFALSDIEPLVRRSIIRGIVSQAATIDRETRSTIEANLPHDEGFDIRLVDGRSLIAKVGQGTYVIAANLVFSLNLNLKGPWFVGLRRSCGYGEIREINWN